MQIIPRWFFAPCPILMLLLLLLHMRPAPADAGGGCVQVQVAGRRGPDVTAQATHRPRPIMNASGQVPRPPATDPPCSAALLQLLSHKT
ncbi:hypothetical protein IWX46DRAFT_610233 [Phyllosticta citricarpa]|uniref:Secreted protein n=1 Tax=Phyllosticta citricarpa TaxID=55181 RepID=A0ABR1LNE4_9PEZI